MTKTVRIENADGSPHVAVVHTENKNSAGEWVRTVSEELSYPTSMATKIVFGGQRLVIEEKRL